MKAKKTIGKQLESPKALSSKKIFTTPKNDKSSISTHYSTQEINPTLSQITTPGI